MLPMITDDIVDEDGVSTATHFTIQSWLLYKLKLCFENTKDAPLAVKEQ